MTTIQASETLMQEDTAEMMVTAADASEVTTAPDEYYYDASTMNAPATPKPTTTRTTTHTTRATAATTPTTGCEGRWGLGTLQTPRCWWWLAVLVGLAAIAVLLAWIAALLCWRCIKDGKKRNK